MSIIKKFEAFSTGQALVTTIESLNSYYSCDECNALWKSFNAPFNKCKYCQSTDIEELNVDEWYDLIESRLEPDEFQEILKEREAEAETLVDLTKLNKNRYDN